MKKSGVLALALLVALTVGMGAVEAISVVQGNSYQHDGQTVAPGVQVVAVCGSSYKFVTSNAQGYYAAVFQNAQCPVGTTALAGVWGSFGTGTMIPFGAGHAVTSINFALP